MNKLIAPLVALALCATTCATLVGAFHVGVASADSGSAVAPAPAAAAPADTLHDPVSAPGAALDDLKAAQKLGWGVAVLAALVLGARLLGSLSSWFSFLATGKVALVIGAVGAFAVTAYNAIALGGSWMAAVFAAVVAAAAWWDSHAKPKLSSV